MKIEGVVKIEVDLGSKESIDQCVIFLSSLTNKREKKEWHQELPPLMYKRNRFEDEVDAPPKSMDKPHAPLCTSCKERPVVAKGLCIRCYNRENKKKKAQVEVKPVVVAATPVVVPAPVVVRPLTASEEVAKENRRKEEARIAEVVDAAKAIKCYNVFCPQKDDPTFTLNPRDMVTRYGFDFCGEPCAFDFGNRNDLLD